MGVGDSRVGHPEVDPQKYERNSHGDVAGAAGVGFLAGRVKIRRTAANGPGVYRDTEPRVVLDNKSSYRVSYWVIEEDTHNNPWDAARRERLIGSMKRYLNATNLAREQVHTLSVEQPVVGEKINGTEKEASVEEEDDGDADEGVYFLTRDHRMQMKGATQATRVPFPVESTEMRVFAFFEDNARRPQRKWHLFLDRQISIRLFRKVFTVTASDEDITPYVKRLFELPAPISSTDRWCQPVRPTSIVVVLLYRCCCCSCSCCGCSDFCCSHIFILL